MPNLIKFYYKEVFWESGPKIAYLFFFLKGACKYVRYDRIKEENTENQYSWYLKMCNKQFSSIYPFHLKFFNDNWNRQSQGYKEMRRRTNVFLFPKWDNNSYFTSSYNVLKFSLFDYYMWNFGAFSWLLVYCTAVRPLSLWPKYVVHKSVLGSSRVIWLPL